MHCLCLFVFVFYWLFLCVSFFINLFYYFFQLQYFDDPRGAPKGNILVTFWPEIVRRFRCTEIALGGLLVLRHQVLPFWPVKNLRANSHVGQEKILSLSLVLKQGQVL